MKQVARRLRDGRLQLIQVPDPEPAPGSALVRLHVSVVSAGTERATLQVARKGLIGKARARPDQARQVIDRVRREGLSSTWQLVRQRLDELGPLGYSAAGKVEAVGPGVTGISPGDAVAVAGGGYANHSELDVVPSLLCARIPGGVSPEDAAFATLGSIALNGFRLGGAEIGGTVAVIGLGVVGQLAVRIARAAGCHVLATDLAPELVAMADGHGVEARQRGSISERWSGRADAVLICAASSSSDPMELATDLARDRGAVVVVGDVGLHLRRAPFYEKELQLRVARSYGPGRHDPEYELHGHDYPVGYARWTIRRNMGAFLDLVSSGSIDPSELVTHRFDFDDAERAFDVLDEVGTVAGVLLDYADGGRPGRLPSPARREPIRRSSAMPRFGLIGAGRFATSTLVPGLITAGFVPVAVASATGLSAEGVRGQFEFERAVGDPGDIVGASDLDVVVIATRHDTHSALVARSLAAGKATYVEKPLAIDDGGLSAVSEVLAESNAPLLIGFNRRYAPLIEEVARLFEGPRMVSVRVNAGALDDHWLNDEAVGGGRLVGEGCHFVDLILRLVEADPVRVTTSGYSSDARWPRRCADNVAVKLEFADGSVGLLTYSSDAPTDAGKERIEVSGSAGLAVIDDFRSASVWSSGGRRKLGRGRGRGRQDKGYARQYQLLAKVICGAEPAPSPEGYLVSTVATLAAARSLESGQTEDVILQREPHEVNVTD